jgi:hypothetical protein
VNRSSPPTPPNLGLPPSGDTPAQSRAAAASLDAGWIAEAVNRAGIGVWRLDLASDLLVGSDGLYRMLEMPTPSGPLPAVRVRSLLHPDERERAAALTEALLASGQPQESQLRYVLHGGRVLRLLSRRTLLRDGQQRPQAVLGVTLDVTDHHAREQRSARALADARERVALAVGGAGIGTWEWWPHNGMARWDEHMFRLRGLAPREHALTHEERMALVHPEDRERVAEAMARGSDTVGDTLAIEFRIVRPDGQLRWLASRSVTLADADSGQLRRIGVNWDITDRRMAEQARRDA